MLTIVLEIGSGLETKVFQLKLKATLRDLKRRGFDLYERCKKETGRIFDEIHVMARKMKTE